MSRTRAQAWIASGAVQIDGRIVRRAASRLREGAAIEVALSVEETRRQQPLPEVAPLDILFQDDAIVVIDKPPGLVVHPSYKHPTGTLLNALLGRLDSGIDVRPGIVTRLDKDTSGVALVALGPTVHATIQRDAAAGRIRKEYLAIVHGVLRPRAGTIRVPLMRDPFDRRRMVAAPHGMASETRYEVIDVLSAPAGGGAHSTADRRSTFTLVRCELLTGRTHQIRVHLATRGCPVAGDRVYGSPPHVCPRQALHAWRITLPHPITRQSLTMTAPIPDDFSGWSHALVDAR